MHDDEEEVILNTILESLWLVKTSIVIRRKELLSVFYLREHLLQVLNRVEPRSITFVPIWDEGIFVFIFKY